MCGGLQFPVLHTYIHMWGSSVFALWCLWACTVLHAVCAILLEANRLCMCTSPASSLLRGQFLVYSVWGSSVSSSAYILCEGLQCLTCGGGACLAGMRSHFQSLFPAGSSCTLPLTSWAVCVCVCVCECVCVCVCVCVWVCECVWGCIFCIEIQSQK